MFTCFKVLLVRIGKGSICIYMPRGRFTFSCCRCGASAGTSCVGAGWEREHLSRECLYSYFIVFVLTISWWWCLSVISQKAYVVPSRTAKWFVTFRMQHTIHC